MLSPRAREKCSELNVPMWFVPAAADQYHPELRPGGIVSLATAENTLIHEELAKFASAACCPACNGEEWQLMAHEVELPPAAFTYTYSSDLDFRLPLPLM